MQGLRKKTDFKITLEPFIFLAIFGWSAMNGTPVRTKLLSWKICEIDLGYEEDLCKNISSNDTVQSQVQIKVNEFEMVNEWLSKVYIIKHRCSLNLALFIVKVLQATERQTFINDQV